MDPITISAGISHVATASGGFAGFLAALGKGLATLAKAGLGAAAIIGEHADELFPDHYNAYERYQLPYDAEDVFGDDDYLQNHVFNLPKNRMIMTKLAHGDLLEDIDIKQMDHVSQVLDARAKTEPQKFAAQSFRTHALQALVGNQLLHLPKENGKVQYRGTWVTESQAPYVVKSDLHRLFQKDRRMSASEIKEWSKSHYPRPRNYQPISRGAAHRFQLSNEEGLLNPIAASNQHSEQSARSLSKFVPPGYIKDPLEKVARLNALRKQEEAQRFEQIKQYMENNYINERQGKTKIYWKDIPDIVDFVAEATKSEEEFRTALWKMFGTNLNGKEPSLYLQYFDQTNQGLPRRYHNVDEQGRLLGGEQLHHYLGGVTGDDGSRFFGIPSHHLNNVEVFGVAPFALGNEYKERLEKNRKYLNQGDINLFDIARKHYKDFNKPGGRFTVGDNIRKMLKEQK